jgi:lysozyme
MTSPGEEIALQEEQFRGAPYFATNYEKKNNMASLGYGMRYYPCGREVLITDDKISQAQALSYFTDLFSQARNYVAKKLLVTTSTNQLEALTSFCYNIGYGNFKKSVVLEYHNKRDFQQAYDALLKYVYQDGEELGGLVRRRKREQQLYRS